MNRTNTKGDGSLTRYLSPLGAWALAFGCSVGWGAFVMPGTTFLPVAGPIGSVLGIAIGGLIMLAIGMNYHYLMNRYPDSGGTYAYAKYSFGYDHGFLNGWFLLLTYVAIIWANATALPLIARHLFGGLFQFGFHYRIAGFDIYMGEVLLAVAALVIAAMFCIRGRIASLVQIAMALLLGGGIVVAIVAVIANPQRAAAHIAPAFSPNQSPASGTFTIIALAPWAYVGFESISHSTGEFGFSVKRSFRIMAIAVVTAAAAYVALAILAVCALPEGCASWTDYILNLGGYEGIRGLPTFFSAETVMGSFGTVILGLTTLGAIVTGLVGNYIASSRLLYAMAQDDMMPRSMGRLDGRQVPRKAILFVMAVSVALPFFGRTAISWIVDVTTVGATIAYAYTSAAAYKSARREENRLVRATGLVGLIISLVFVLYFLIPNLIAVKTLSTESYLILASWGILGFMCFLYLFRRDSARHLGRSPVVWVVLLTLIIFTSTVWMRQATEVATEKAVTPIQTFYTDKMMEQGIDIVSMSTRPVGSYLRETLDDVGRTLTRNSLIQTALIVVSLAILLYIYHLMQKREKQMEVEKVLAEESNRAKTSFLSNMSHEIRTPMNAIIGLDNIALKDPDLSPHTREQLEKIGASAKHLLLLINDILDMSCIESGRMVLKDEEFSFRDFIDQINVIVNGQCVDKGLEFDCQIIGQVKDYYIGDDMKLKQVLINILGNAVKFTPVPGAVTFTVEQIATFENYCTLRFIMKDTGIGMSKEYLPKLFDAFSQEFSGTSNQYGSTGLGMAITKNIVDMMNGEIHVESEKNKGTTFTVTVTLTASDRSVSSEQGNALPKGLRALVVEDSGGKTRSLEGCRVLIAEDMDINADILMDLLEMEGIESERAENGRIAVDMFDQSAPNHYDAVLMDVRMPVMDGLEATRALRALDREDAKTVPVIAMTANAFDDDVQRSLQAGMSAHLSKPVEPERLYETLDQLIHRA